MINFYSGSSYREIADRTRWWYTKRGDDDTLAARLSTVRTQIEIDNASRREELATMRAIFLDEDCDRYGDFGYHRKLPSRYPLLQGAVESTHAQLTVSRPRPKIVTVNGDHVMHRRATLRQRWIDGVYHRLDAYERLSEIVLDALIFGTGCLKVGEEDDETTVDRVWCGDLWVDPQEARHYRVSTLYQMHALDRDVLKAMYPDRAEEIDGITETLPPESLFPDLEIDGYQTDQLLRVVEAWRLPASRKAPGRHVIACGNLILLDEEWTQKRFPFVFYRWGLRPLGFWGQGMIARGMAMQSDINELTEILQEHYGTMVPQLWADVAARVAANELTDEVGKVNWARPGPGGIQTAVMALSPDVAPGLLQREARLAERLLNILGVDRMAAQAEKPPGLYSAAAMEQWNSSVATRFLPQGRRLEAASMELAELLFHFADKIAARGVMQRETVFGRDIGLELLEYGSVKAANGEIYRVQIKPGSALPRDIAGRIQAVISLRDGAGLQLDPLTIAEMLELPDLDALEEELFAARHNVRDAIARCELPEDEEPQPVASTFWPKEFALQLIAAHINRAAYRGADESTLERLRNLHGQVRNMPLEPSAATPPGTPPAPPPIDPATAGMPPVPMGAPAPGMPPMPPMPSPAAA